MKNKPKLKPIKPEGFYKPYIDFHVYRPRAQTKMHRGFMYDGTAIEDIKSVDDFFTHVLHTDGADIANASFSLVEDNK